MVAIGGQFTVSFMDFSCSCNGSIIYCRLYVYISLTLCTNALNSIPGYWAITSFHFVTFRLNWTSLESKSEKCLTWFRWCLIFLLCPIRLSALLPSLTRYWEFKALWKALRTLFSLLSSMSLEDGALYIIWNNTGREGGEREKGREKKDEMSDLRDREGERERVRTHRQTNERL